MFSSVLTPVVAGIALGVIGGRLESHLPDSTVSSGGRNSYYYYSNYLLGFYVIIQNYITIKKYDRN